MSAIQKFGVLGDPIAHSKSPAKRSTIQPSNAPQTSFRENLLIFMNKAIRD